MGQVVSFTQTPLFGCMVVTPILLAPSPSRFSLYTLLETTLCFKEDKEEDRICPGIQISLVVCTYLRTASCN